MRGWNEGQRRSRDMELREMEEENSKDRERKREGIMEKTQVI